MSAKLENIVTIAINPNISGTRRRARIIETINLTIFVPAFSVNLHRKPEKTLSFRELAGGAILRNPLQYSLT